MQAADTKHFQPTATASQGDVERQGVAAGGGSRPRPPARFPQGVEFVDELLPEVHEQGGLE